MELSGFISIGWISCLISDDVPHVSDDVLHVGGSRTPGDTSCAQRDMLSSQVWEADGSV